MSRDDDEGGEPSPAEAKAETGFTASQSYLQMHIGRLMRNRRRMVEMTQQQLATNCGVSFQQIQKYEAGEASIYAARLWAIACALGVSVGYFFESAPSRARL